MKNDKNHQETQFAGDLYPILLCLFSIGINTEDLPEEAVPVASVETEVPLTETEINSPTEETVSEEVSSESSLETPATFSADADEAKTFNDYFPDPNFARVVAKAVDKAPEQLTNKEELSKVGYISNAENINNIEGIGLLKGLYYFYLSGSFMTEFQVEIENLTNLEKFYIHVDSLEKIPENIDNLANLVSLSIVLAPFQTFGI